MQVAAQPLPLSLHISSAISPVNKKTYFYFLNLFKKLFSYQCTLVMFSLPQLLPDLLQLPTHSTFSLPLPLSKRERNKTKNEKQIKKQKNLIKTNRQKTNRGKKSKTTKQNSRYTKIPMSSFMLANYSWAEDSPWDVVDLSSAPPSPQAPPTQPTSHPVILL